MRKLGWLLSFLLLASTSLAAVFEPADKLRTYSEIIMLRGQTEAAGTLEVNGRELKQASDGSFSCGLVLKPGKNLVEVRRRGQKQILRVLRFASYPDIETLYDGRWHWARGNIVYLSTLGMIEGDPDGNFYPGRPVSRGELATWLVRCKKLPVPTLTEDVFFDVPKEHWRAPYVKAAVQAGFVPPYSKENFGIDDPLSRREVAEIVVLTEGLGVVDKITPFFEDVPQEEKGAAPIYTAKERGLVVGVSKDIPVYDPERALTRAEAATLLSRFGLAQREMESLVNFEAGYSRDRFCALNVAPEIASFAVEPDRVRLKQTVSVKLRAEIAAREGFSPISKVKVDLSQIGGLPDAEMFDDGTRGDEKEGDLVYSLNISFTPEIGGEKKLTVTAVDRLGWEGKKDSPLLILE